MSLKSLYLLPLQRSIVKLMVSILEGLEKTFGQKIKYQRYPCRSKTMDDKRFVKSRFGGITEDRGGRRKKHYVITPSGKRCRQFNTPFPRSYINRFQRSHFSKLLRRILGTSNVNPVRSIHAECFRTLYF